MMEPIRFGTSGWRGVIADDFTFERVRVAVAAIAAYLHEKGESGGGVLVAHDGRFAGEDFSRLAAETLTESGVDVLLCEGMTPTPAVSHAILHQRLGGAINFTASHNPPRWQGLKFNPSWGGPALPAATARIEELAAGFLRGGCPPPALARGTIRRHDPAPPYLTALKKLVKVDRIAAGGGLLLYDALHGAGAGYLDRLLEEEGGRVEVLHGWRDPLFGGGSPDPSRERLTELAAWARERNALGVATDGDGDRYGIVGPEGEFYPPNLVLALLADYLLGVRKVQGRLARSVATTNWLDEIAASYGRTCAETPVGFKYIAEMIARQELALGGEESAGFSMAGHVPEKDGILVCLLVAEMVAVLGQPLAQLHNILARRFGERHSHRDDVPLTAEILSSLRRRMANPPQSVGERRALKVSSPDGTKWVFGPREWALVRLSGTEPLARLYVESDTREGCLSLASLLRAWVAGGD